MAEMVGTPRASAELQQSVLAQLNFASWPALSRVLESSGWAAKLMVFRPYQSLEQAAQLLGTEPGVLQKLLLRPLAGFGLGYNENPHLLQSFGGGGGGNNNTNTSNDKDHSHSQDFEEDSQNNESQLSELDILAQVCKDATPALPSPAYSVARHLRKRSSSTATTPSEFAADIPAEPGSEEQQHQAGLKRLRSYSWTTGDQALSRNRAAGISDWELEHQLGSPPTMADMGEDEPQRPWRQMGVLAMGGGGSSGSAQDSGSDAMSVIDDEDEEHSGGIRGGGIRGGGDDYGNDDGDDEDDDDEEEEEEEEMDADSSLDWEPGRRTSAASSFTRSGRSTKPTPKARAARGRTTSRVRGGGGGGTRRPRKAPGDPSTATAATAAAAAETTASSTELGTPRRGRGGRREGSARKQFRCRFCGQAFGGSGNCKRHERIHGDERPFPCSFCPNRFRRSDHLRNHIKALHTEDHDDWERNAAGVLMSP